jgi:hypothetical protein
MCTSSNRRHRSHGEKTRVRPVYEGFSRAMDVGGASAARGWTSLMRDSRRHGSRPSLCVRRLHQSIDPFGQKQQCGRVWRDLAAMVKQGWLSCAKPPLMNPKVIASRSDLRAEGMASPARLRSQSEKAASQVTGACGPCRGSFARPIDCGSSTELCPTAYYLGNKMPRQMRRKAYLWRAGGLG